MLRWLTRCLRNVAQRSRSVVVTSSCLISRSISSRSRSRSPPAVPLPQPHPQPHPHPHPQSQQCRTVPLSQVYSVYFHVALDPAAIPLECSLVREPWDGGPPAGESICSPGVPASRFVRDVGGVVTCDRRPDVTNPCNESMNESQHGRHTSFRKCALGTARDGGRRMEMGGNPRASF